MSAIVSDDMIARAPARYHQVLRGPEAAYWAARLGLVASVGPAPGTAQVVTEGPETLSGHPPTARLWFVCHRYPRVRHAGLGLNAVHSARVLSGEGLATAALIVDRLDQLDELVRRAPSLRALVLQALWYTPEELAAFAARWPRLQVVARVHSQVAFLATDRRAADVFALARAPGVTLAGNSARFAGDVWAATGLPCAYLPNLYPLGPPEPLARGADRVALEVGLFGAARPQKHHATGAMAAAIVAQRLGRRVRLHFNTNRDEGVGWDLVRAIARASDLELLEHPWAPWDQFRALAREMDLGFQLSSSETFNYVTADLATAGVPSIVGEAIDWAPRDCVAPIDDAAGAAEVALRLLGDPTAGLRWRAALEAHQVEARAVWRAWLAEVGVAPAKSATLPATLPTRGGVGTELTLLLHGGFSALGPLAGLLRPLAPALATALTLPAPEGCGCGRFAAWLDRIGIEESVARREEIVSRLQVQAANQGLPAPPRLVRALVRFATHRARRRSHAHERNPATAERSARSGRAGTS